jgi:hypothetical protein
MRGIGTRYALASLVAALTLAGCGGGDSGAMYKCVYDSRVLSSTCASSTSWTPTCIDFNSDNLTITPQEKCDRVSGSTTCTPSGSCCNTSEVRNVQLQQGTCT